MVNNRSPDRFRALREKANWLNESLLSDLRPFYANNGVFRRLPTSGPPDSQDVNAATSCTALMALCSNRAFDQFFEIKAQLTELENERRKTALKILQRICKAKWESSGLEEDNPFTTVLILRTAGYLAQGYNQAEIREVRRRWRGSPLTLQEIAIKLAKDAPAQFAIDESLRPNPALGYWLVDGADKLGIEFQESWVDLAAWAAKEFTHQASLVSARDDALMDPVAMVMAACMAERLRSMASTPEFSGDPISVKQVLPTRNELEYGVERLFALQEPSGIWDKFFPMFYYRKKIGGANYCFAFEFLEAILAEFGKGIFDNESIRDSVIDGLDRACTWCARKRLQFSYQQEQYRGWNSAQQINTVQTGQPESWATGVVHMFLYRLREVCANEIQKLTLHKYDASFLPLETIQ